MIYYIDNNDVGPITFEHQLKEDLASVFGTKNEVLLQELTMESLHHMAMTFEEVKLGGRVYQILVHPIKYVYMPATPRITEPLPPKGPYNPWWDGQKDWQDNSTGGQPNQPYYTSSTNGTIFGVGYKPSNTTKYDPNGNYFDTAEAREMTLEEIYDKTIGK